MACRDNFKLMRKIIVVAVALLCACISYAQTKFPEDWIGTWKGEISWNRFGNDTVKDFKMQLRIQPADSVGHYTWHIIYGDSSKDSRPYLMKAVDKNKGHWLLDERNGIFIDHYYFAGKLSCAFTVQNTTIINNCWREGEELIVEFYALSAKAVSTTGLNTDDSPIVNSYGVRSYQRAELKKSK
jgi:hypothetical protein